MGYYLRKIKDYRNQNYNLSFKEIALYILNNLNNLEKMNIYDVSRNTHTSPSTITRFCQTIGLTGFKSLTPYLNAEMMDHTFKRNMDNGTDVEKINENGFLDVYTNLVLLNIKNLLMEKELFIKCVEKINAAKRIFLFAFGGNANLTIFLYEYLVRLNFNVFFIKDRDCQVAYSKNVVAGDLAFFVSYAFSDKMMHEIFYETEKKGISRIFLYKEMSKEMQLRENDLSIKMMFNEGKNDGRSYAIMAVMFVFSCIVEILTQDQINRSKLINQDAN